MTYALRKRAASKFTAWLGTAAAGLFTTARDETTSASCTRGCASWEIVLSENDQEKKPHPLGRISQLILSTTRTVLGKKKKNRRAIYASMENHLDEIFPEPPFSFCVASKACAL